MKVVIRRDNLINKMKVVNIVIKLLRKGMYISLGSSAIVIIVSFISGGLAIPLFTVWALSILGINVANNVLTDINQSYKNSLTDLTRQFGNYVDELYIDDVEIYPRSIRIGENLEASNAFDIFKKGNYVLIKMSGDALIFKEYEDDEEKAHVLETMDYEDIERFTSSIKPKRLAYVNLITEGRYPYEENK